MFIILLYTWESLVQVTILFLTNTLIGCLVKPSLYGKG